MVQTGNRTPVDHYRTLGVAPDASDADIVRAYRTLAKQLHPDRYGGAGADRALADAADPAGRFASVTEAYRILADPAARRAHDRELAARAARPTRAVDRPARPFVFTVRRARWALGAGVALTVLGLGAAGLAIGLAADASAFRGASEPAVAAVVDGASGREIRFTTGAGDTYQLPMPARSSPGVVGDQVPIRYDLDDPTRVRIDESTAARDVTVGIAAVKLLVAGPVFVVLARRRLRRGDAPSAG